MTFTGVTTGTILYQWIVVFIASIFLSRWYNKKIVANYYDGEEFPEMPGGSALIPREKVRRLYLCGFCG